jgi:TRAP-type C4-dicarboxylate transport system substrate-binding protein
MLMLKSSRWNRVAVAAVGAALALGAAGRAARADNVEWRIATLAPDGSSWMKILTRGADEVSKATAGRVTIKYYPGGVQGDEKDVVAKMQLGQLDGGAFTTVGLGLIDESVRIFELPMLVKSVEELDFLRDKRWEHYQKAFEKKGYMLGDPGDVGFLYFYSNTPIKSVADLANVKVWLWGDDKIVKAMFKKLGVNGVPMGPNDVLPSLTTGKISACYASPLAAMALQWYTKVKYSTSMSMAYGIGATVLTKKAWDKLSAEDQAAVTKVFKIQAAKLRKAIRKDNESSFKAITRSGVQVIDTPAAMVADFDKKSQEVWKELVGKVYSQDDLDSVLKLRAEYRAAHP